jgi:hypothetical protein
MPRSGARAKKVALNDMPLPLVIAMQDGSAFVPLNGHGPTFYLISEFRRRIGQKKRAKNAIVFPQSQCSSRRPAFVDKDRAVAPQAAGDAFSLGVKGHIGQCVLCAGFGKWDPFIADDQDDGCRVVECRSCIQYPL